MWLKHMSGLTKLKKKVSLLRSFIRSLCIKITCERNNFYTQRPCGCPVLGAARREVSAGGGGAGGEPGFCWDRWTGDSRS